jgi:succinylglutamic semialdehyde dehydrogenase
VALKPSELAPAVSETLVDLWLEAGLPAGVLNLVQGGPEIGAQLAQHPGVDGIFFTGSHAAGLSIRAANARQPQKVIALEMGGNSPLVVWDYDDVRTAVLIAIQSCFITSGQRCSAARRLIVPSDDEAFITLLSDVVSRIRVGRPSDEPEPYMGPMINSAHVERVLDAQERLIGLGATSLVKARQLELGPAFISPGLIDVTAARDVPDEEVFGPLLQVTRVDDFDTALTIANRTQYGLAAGLVSKEAKKYERFLGAVEAGIVNWNQQLTGASGLAPFGGIKASGNHRPSGFLAADYCSYSVASMENEEPALPEKLPPGLDL